MAKGEHLFWRKHSIDLINEMVLKKLARKHGVFRAMGMLMIAQDYLAAHDFIDKSNDGIESLLMFCNDNQATEDEIISFLDDVVATGYFELDEQGRYFCPNVFVEYQKKKDLSKKRSESGELGGKAKVAKNNDNPPTGGGKSEPQEQAAPPAESEPKPKKEKKKPEPEPDVELTTEGMALRSDVIAYTYDLDFNEDMIEMTNKEWNRIAERHGDDAELRCRFYYEWKASKIVNGKRFKNLDFHTINTASWITEKIDASRRHNGKSNKQLTGAPLEPGTGRAALLHGD